MTRGAVTTGSADTDRTLLELLSWALPQALGSLQGPGAHQRLSVSSPKCKSHLTSSLSAEEGLSSSSCSPSPGSCLIHSSISLLLWKPSTRTTQRKAGFKQSPCPGTLCYLESTSVLEFPFFPVPAALEEVLAAPGSVPEMSLSTSCPGDPRMPRQWGRMGGSKCHTRTLWDPSALYKTLDILPPWRGPARQETRPFHTP